MNDLRRLVVWQRAHQAALEACSVTGSFPTGESYGLVSQKRRAAASVAANIAESRGRGTARDEARFLHIVAGSAWALEYRALLARHLGYSTPQGHARLHDLVVEWQRKLAALLRRVARALR